MIRQTICDTPEASVFTVHEDYGSTGTYKTYAHPLGSRYRILYAESLAGAMANHARMVAQNLGAAKQVQDADMQDRKP